MWNYIQQAHLIGYILVGVSVLSVAVIIDRILFWAWRAIRIRSRFDRRRLIEAFAQRDSDRIRAEIGGSSGPEAEALRFLAEHLHVPGDTPVDAQVEREVRRTNRWLVILDVNGSIAPMFGILGTVVGIIQAFQGMKGSTPDTAVMVSGLSVSMLTTAIGLVVALLSIIPYNIFAAHAHHRQQHFLDLLRECWMAREKNRENTNSPTRSEPGNTGIPAHAINKTSSSSAVPEDDQQ